MEGYEIGEFDEDGALDERDELIAWLRGRIHKSLGLPEFCGVDISGVRANVAMLATVIRCHGGGHLIERRTVRDWGQRLDEPFVSEEMWGFEPWPDDVKATWRLGCQQTIQSLLAVLEE